MTAHVSIYHASGSTLEGASVAVPRMRTAVYEQVETSGEFTATSIFAPDNSTCSFARIAATDADLLIGAGINQPAGNNVIFLASGREADVAIDPLEKVWIKTV